jgi:hypothetical protein
MTVQAESYPVGSEIVRHKRGYDFGVAVGGAVAFGGAITLINLVLGLEKEGFLPFSIPATFDRARLLWNVAVGAIAEAAVIAIAITIVIKINIFEKITQFVRTGATVLNDDKLRQLQEVLNEKLQGDNARLRHDLAHAQRSNAELKDLLAQVQLIIGRIPNVSELLAALSERIRVAIDPNAPPQSQQEPPTS